MLGVDIRFCGALDVPSILALNDLVSPPWPRAVILDDFSDNGKSVLSYLGAFARGRGGQLLGYAVLGSEKSRALLADLKVSPACRRRGVGMQLLVAVAECAASMGFSALSLRVRESNVAAQSLYRAFGFMDEGECKNYYANGEHALLMKLTLPLAISGG